MSVAEKAADTPVLCCRRQQVHCCADDWEKQPIRDKIGLSVILPYCWLILGVPPDR